MKLPGPDGGDSLHERLDHVFSRKVLGAVIVAVAAKKVLSLGFHLLFTSPQVRFAAWTAVFVGAIALFAWWDHAERTTEQAAKKAAEKTAVAAERAADKAAEKTGHEKVEAAERATDEVADRVKGSTESATKDSGDESAKSSSTRSTDES